MEINPPVFNPSFGLASPRPFPTTARLASPTPTALACSQAVELYTEDGVHWPFFCFLETPGSGNVVRIVNTAPVEFPMTASVVPKLINMAAEDGVVIGGHD